MIFVVDGRDNTLLVDNGQAMDSPIKIHLSTVCTGEYTDFVIDVPKDSEICRDKWATKGRRKLATRSGRFIVRVFSKQSGVEEATKC